jgi:histidinol-phosphate aminotransferase
MFELPKKVKDLTPYEPLIGDYKIRLDANESFINSAFKMPVVKYPELNRYPDPYAEELLKVFCKRYAFADIQPENVTAFNGSDEAISVIYSAFFDKGDKVGVFEHDFSMYYFYPNISELDVKKIAKTDELNISVVKTNVAIKANLLKSLMFSNPCNPTGLAIGRSEVVRLIENNPDTLVVVDEAYMEFWDEGQSVLSLVSTHDNLIVLKTASKAFGSAGIRLGFAVCSEKLTHVLKSVKSPYNVNSFTQAYGTKLFETDYTAHIEACKASVKALHKEIVDIGLFHKVFDTRANFVFVQVKEEFEDEIQNASADKFGGKKIYDYLLSKSIAVRLIDGNHLRITAGADEENAEVINALKEFKGRI